MVGEHLEMLNQINEGYPNCRLAMACRRSRQSRAAATGRHVE
jgi:hypothetical protein